MAWPLQHWVGLNKQKFKELCFHLAVNSDLCTCFLPSCNRKLDQLSKQTSVIHSLGTITYLCCNILVSFAGFHFLCFLHCFCSESQLCCTFCICQALGVTILILFTFYYSYEQFKLKFYFCNHIFGIMVVYYFFHTYCKVSLHFIESKCLLVCKNVTHWLVQYYFSQNHWKLKKQNCNLWTKLTCFHTFLLLHADFGSKNTS